MFIEQEQQTNKFYWNNVTKFTVDIFCDLTIEQKIHDT